MATESGSSGFAPGSSPNLSERVSAVAGEAKARAADLGRKVTDTTDQARSKAAGGLSAAAGAIGDNAEQGADRAGGAAQRTANALSSSADYVRNHTAQEMMDDAMQAVKNNPGVALLGAVTVGFLVSRLFSSRSN